MDAVAAKYNFSEMVGRRGITQLRWATFGEPSQVNAQPHLDSDGDIVGAHNGNVVNNFKLRQQFIAEGLTVRSENDGESCVHAVEHYINKGYDFVDAIRLAYGDLAGDYAFVIGQARDDRLYAIKKGSGLVVGLGEDAEGQPFTCVSSDLPSILPLTRKIVRIQDDEIIILWPDHVELLSVKDGQRIEREPEIVTQSMDAVQKGGYPHFMLKEIHEQPQVARELLHLLGEASEVNTFLEQARKARNLYLLGCGTSYHACLLGAVYFAQLAGRAAIPVLAPQFIRQYAPAVNHEDLGVFVSQSGETKDVLSALQVAEKRGMTAIGIANVIGSTLTKAAACWLPLGCGYEISVPATKTFTNQVVTFLYLAYRLAGLDSPPLEGIPDLMEQTLEMTAPQMEALAGEINSLERFILPGLRGNLPDRAGGGAQTQGDHLRSLRGDALHRVQARAAFSGERWLSGALCRPARRRALDRQRHQRGHLPWRASDRHRRGGCPPAR